MHLVLAKAIIPKEYEDKYRVWLSEMKALSVREESGAKIIKDLIGRDAPVLVDPTLLISKEHWLSIAKKHQTDLMMIIF